MRNILHIRAVLVLGRNSENDEAQGFAVLLDGGVLAADCHDGDHLPDGGGLGMGHCNPLVHDRGGLGLAGKHVLEARGVVGG